MNALERRRRLTSRLMLAVCGLCAAVVLLPLFLLLFYVIREGAAGLTWAFFTHLPAPPGESGGGLGNGIVGTLELLGLAVLIGFPLGLAGGVYVAELSNERLTWLVRFAADALNGIPTIVIGIFVYALVVVPMHSFSAAAGGLALALVMLPVVLRASDEVLRQVPHTYREAALALGASRWQVVHGVILRAAKGGLVGAAILGIARVAGETAPLLFTAFGSSQWNVKLGQPIASLTVEIYNYATGPYDDWHRQAWAGALTLIAMIVVTGALSRLWIGRRA